MLNPFIAYVLVEKFGGVMFKFIKKFLNTKNEIKNLKYVISSLSADVKQIISLSEKYLPLMKTTDKIQLLILRRNLWTKKP